MAKITSARRSVVRDILRDSNQYDASTLRITRDGMVTALKDADKTLDAPETLRWQIGHVDDMVDADANRREGW